MASRNQSTAPAVQRLIDLYVGCAGWSLPKQYAASFGADGTHLQRYAQRFRCVEINSSFYRSHRRATYQRWAEATPIDFRFAVKLPKQITHIRRLVSTEAQLTQFAEETAGLREKLGVVLVQLPPSLAFDSALSENFFKSLRTRFAGPVVCEPRHGTWFIPEAESLLRSFRIDRVAADPSLSSKASEPGGVGELAYFRWHGSPRMYYSAYDANALQSLKHRIDDASLRVRGVWCIFDNTAAGAAVANALDLAESWAAAARPEPMAAGKRGY